MQKDDAFHKHIALTVPPWIMTDSAAVWDTIAPLGEERRWEAKKVLYTFTFPFFMLTYVPISIAALVGKVEWKPICHTRVMTLEQIEEPGLRAS